MNSVMYGMQDKETFWRHAFDSKYALINIEQVENNHCNSHTKVLQEHVLKVLIKLVLPKTHTNFTLIYQISVQKLLTFYAVLHMNYKANFYMKTYFLTRKGSLNSTKVVLVIRFSKMP